MPEPIIIGIDGICDAEDIPSPLTDDFMSQCARQILDDAGLPYGADCTVAYDVDARTRVITFHAEDAAWPPIWDVLSARESAQSAKLDCTRPLGVVIAINGTPGEPLQVALSAIAEIYAHIGPDDAMQCRFAIWTDNGAAISVYAPDAVLARVYDYADYPRLAAEYEQE
jgi:hypothetical protein